MKVYKWIILILGIVFLLVAVFFFAYNYTELITPIEVFENWTNNVLTICAVGGLFVGGALVFWFSNIKDAEE